MQIKVNADEFRVQNAECGYIQRCEKYALIAEREQQFADMQNYKAEEGLLYRTGIAD